MKRGETQKEQSSAIDHSALLRHNARALANQIICYYPTYIIVRYTACTLVVLCPVQCKVNFA
jgi:hypothetical protein